MRSRRGTPALFTQLSLTLIPGNLALCSEVNFRQIPFSETQDSRRHREEGPGFFTKGKLEKGAPVPRQLRTHHQKGLRLHFYTFGIRGSRLSSGKAGERGFFYVSSSRNGDERHLRAEL